MTTACRKLHTVYKHNIDKEENHMLINPMDFLCKFEKNTDVFQK